MKVILLDDVRGVGMRGEQADVADGYARNFLIPQQKALRATKATIRRAIEHDKFLAKKESGDRADAEARSSKFAGVKVKIKVNAEDGRLYGSVGAAEIMTALDEQNPGLGIERKDILLRSTIKHVGTYQVPIQLFRDVQPTVEVEVISDAPPKEKLPEPKPAEDLNASLVADHLADDADEAVESTEGADGTDGDEAVEVTE